MGARAPHCPRPNPKHNPNPKPKPNPNPKARPRKVSPRRRPNSRPSSRKGALSSTRADGYHAQRDASVHVDVERLGALLQAAFAQQAEDAAPVARAQWFAYGS